MLRSSGTLASSHAIDHVALVAVDDALVDAFGDEQADFLFADVLLRTRVHAEQPQQSTRDPNEEKRERRRKPGEQAHRQSGRGREALGIDERDALGQQLAEQHLDERDARDRDDDADRQAVAVDVRQIERVDAGADALAERRAEHGARAHLQQRDEHLHGREKALGLFGERERDLGASARHREMLEAALARDHQGHLAQREEPIQQCEQHDQ